ncbi:MAG: hypothetical protein Q4D21_10115 [Phascolarctobacterium sp.]|nr:hypothetical protein [Phascolarctobacterium sp.]
MCILCGEMIMSVHWTDQPLHDSAYRNKKIIVAGELQRGRRRMRLKRVAIANKILNYYGLKINDWNGSRYMLFDKKGMSKVVYDLGGMWQAATDLCHKKIDPLDSDFLQYLQEGK